MKKSIHESKKTNFTYASTTTYSMVLQYYEDFHDVASFFRKPHYNVRLFSNILSSNILTVTYLLNIGPDPKLVNEYSLPHGLKRSLKPIESLPLQMVNRKFFHVEGIFSTFVRISDFPVCARFGVVEKFVPDILLGASLIDQCIQRIFSTGKRWRLQFEASGDYQDKFGDKLNLR